MRDPIKNKEVKDPIKISILRLLIIILCLTSDLDPYWAHADYSLFTYREKTQLKKDLT